MNGAYKKFLGQGAEECPKNLGEAGDEGSPSDFEPLRCGRASLARHPAVPELVTGLVHWSPLLTTTDGRVCPCDVLYRHVLLDQIRRAPLEALQKGAILCKPSFFASPSPTPPTTFCSSICQWISPTTVSFLGCAGEQSTPHFYPR